MECASVLAGPSVGLFLAELGAEVVKIENKPTNGDVTRRWKLPSEDPNAPFSAYYACVNQGKTTLLLDLSTSEDRAIAMEYIAEADIFIGNFREESARKLGLDYASLKAQYPRLIYAQLNGFGKDDPRPAFDVVLQAEAGFLYLTGEQGRAPVKMPVALIDLLAAHQLKEGILLALMNREKTGNGCLVETSLLESAIASLANQATNWLMGGVIPQRIGTQHPNIAPYGDLFHCADGKEVVLAVGTERQFHALSKLLNHPEWAADLKFSTNAARVQHREHLNTEIREALVQVPSDLFIEQCNAHDVPVGRVRTMNEVFEQENAQKMVVDWTLPDGTSAKSVRSIAFRLS